ncbi:hypothetical protein H0H87_010784 [Tephrocybe sp. NHM501043]|nr:hypothetical protein H0H87_010784 [Tephrocybe sp. NHM501043]
MSYNRPKVEGYDDLTGEPLTKRPDDNPEVFSRRLSQFYASTSPLLDYYAHAAKSSVTPTRHSHQHPHQLSFHRSKQRVVIKTLSGSTSDENWPVLERAVRLAFPTLKEQSMSQNGRRNGLNEAIFAHQLGTGAGLQD